MALTVADTDVLIDFLAGKGKSAERVSREMERGKLVTTTIARFELLSGMTPKSEKALRAILEAIPALPLDSAGADRAAEVRRVLERSGESIGMGDSLIAGIVLEAGGELLTRNTKHFARVRGLRLAALRGDA
jgi:predicted nucleic acid-binding protein